MEKKLRKVVPYVLGIFFLLTITLFIVGTFKDLEISHALYHPDHLFGEAMSFLAPLPSCFFMGAIGAFVFRIFNKKNGVLNKIFGYLVLIVFQVVAFILYGKDGVDETINNLILSFVIAFFIQVGIVIFIFYFTKKSKEEDLIRATWCILLSMIFVLLTVIILKEIFNRPRPFLIFEYGDQYFTPWYSVIDLPKEIVETAPSSYFGSFPSGHTSYSTLVLLVPVFLSLNEKTKNYQSLSVFIGVAWIMLTMFSRMLLGNHFLTDVTFSAMLGIIFTTFFQYFVKDLGKDNEKEMYPFKTTDYQIVKRYKAERLLIEKSKKQPLLRAKNRINKD